MKNYILKIFIITFFVFLLFLLVPFFQKLTLGYFFTLPKKEIITIFIIYICPFIIVSFVFSIYYILLFLITWFISKRFIKIKFIFIIILTWIFIEMENTLLNFILFTIFDIALYIWIVFLIKNSYSLRKDL